MATHLLYCSGSISKGANDAGKLLWTDAERQQVRAGAVPDEVVFLNPDDPIVRPDNTLGQFGRDMYQVTIATAVVVDGRERRGIGVGVEIAAAAAMEVPVVAVVPPGTTYRRGRTEYRSAVVDNYVHPHLAALATVIVDSFGDAGAAVRQLPSRKPSVIPRWLHSALAEYETEILPFDPPMQRVISNDPQARVRL